MNKCKYLLDDNTYCCDTATHYYVHTSISRYNLPAQEIIRLCDKHNNDMCDKGYKTIKLED